MGHEKRTKVIAILALIVAVLGLSVGFSAYSKALNIQNVQATVQGNPANFSVVFSTSSTSISNGSVHSNACGPNAQGGASATINGTTISNLSGTFTGAGEVNYVFYAYNNGSIPAYLTGITIGDKTCTGGSGTSKELVDAACNGAYIKVLVQSTDYSKFSKTYYSTTTINDAPKLNPGEYVIVVPSMGIPSGNAVDGDYTIKYGDVTLNYSSQKPSA